MKHILVCGAGGFIGSHLVTRLKNIPAQDNYVVGVDIKQPEYINDCDQFSILDLTNQHAVDDFFLRNHFDVVYQLAADMGGADYIFTGDNDLDIIKHLSKYKVKFGICDGQGNTCLNIAIYHKNNDKN